MHVKRFRPVCQFLKDGTPVAVLCEFPEGYVSGSDYDALAARLAQAERLLREADEQIGLQDAYINYSVKDRIDAFLRTADSASVEAKK